MNSPLVSSEWMAAHLEDPGVVLVQLKYEPDEDDDSDGHIPGAQFWYWKDMLWDDTDRQFPIPELMGKRLGEHGIGEKTTLVLHSGRNQYAAYGYWIIKKMCGHPDVRVLDGSWMKWQAEGREMTTDVPDVTPVVYQVRQTERDDSSRISRGEVRDGLGIPGRVILDGRYASEYNGERVKPGTGFDFGAERYGRIPGAKHLLFKNLMNDDATLKSPEELEAIYRSYGAAPDQADEVVTYCRLGHRGSLLWFTAAEILDWHHFRVYDGSWTEWGSAVGFPVER